MIQLFRPSTLKTELDAIVDCFNTGWLGKGPKVAEFEAAWAAHIGVDPAHVVSVNCATEGLFQVCELLDSEHYWNEYSEVIIPSIHFVGAANAILENGGQLRLCDVDPHTLNPTLEHIQAVYRHQTEAVILLHYGGVAQELDDIRQWCNDEYIVLIEDAACAQATMYKGKAAGTWGNFGVWSFDAMKVMTTGDGGMIYCERKEDADRLRQRVYLGLNEQSGLSNDADKWWEYSVSEPGRRAIMNDMAAGMGLAQLVKLPFFVRRRKEIVLKYDALLYDMPVRIPYGLNSQPYYFYWIQTKHRDELAKYLRSHDIYTTFKYYPLHRVFKTGQYLPGADYAADNTLLLPLHQGLTDNDVEYVCDKVKEFFA